MPLTRTVNPGLSVAISGTANSRKEMTSPAGTAAYRVTSVDWGSYPIMRFSDVPKVEIELVERRNEPPLGAGEAASTPVPAALANAVFDATGARIRTVPFTPERVKAALSGSAS